MAFTGTATVVQVSERKFRITGLSLAATVSGTIGLSTSTLSPGVALPKVPWSPYQSVTLQDAVQCTTAPAATGTATAIPVAVVKSGTTLADFLITLTNTHATVATPNLEIIVEFH